MNYTICKCEAIIEELSKIDYCNQKWLDFIPEHLLHHLLMGHKWCNYGLWSSQYQLYTSKLPLGDNQMCTCRNTRCNIIIAFFQTKEGWVQVPCIMGYSTGQVSSYVNPANIILTRFSCLKNSWGVHTCMVCRTHSLDIYVCSCQNFFNLGLFTISYVS